MGKPAIHLLIQQPYVLYSQRLEQWWDEDSSRRIDHIRHNLELSLPDRRHIDQRIIHNSIDMPLQPSSSKSDNPPSRSTDAKTKSSF